MNAAPCDCYKPLAYAGSTHLVRPHAEWDFKEEIAGKREQYIGMATARQGGVKPIYWPEGSHSSPLSSPLKKIPQNAS